ncbi:unnamed protein product [Notodromas monacha]|uniref:Uncharacterized protein n=1 Tax=Notodromas monacha TaxID=399045 RepID=A0A7R9BNR8_9CRUS|nr:unnamed protein product [Notodromas monacha]CAG0917379.1 unnamed protein product [Notodromas monacha]
MFFAMATRRRPMHALLICVSLLGLNHFGTPNPVSSTVIPIENAARSLLEGDIITPRQGLSSHDPAAAIGTGQTSHMSGYSSGKPMPPSVDEVFKRPGAVGQPASVIDPPTKPCPEDYFRDFFGVCRKSFTFPTSSKKKSLPLTEEVPENEKSTSVVDGKSEVATS